MIFPIKALTSQCKTKSEATPADTAALTSGHCPLPKRTPSPSRFSARSDARVAEEARLESVYTPKAYREFESRSLR